MTKANNAIRNAAKSANVPLWQVAEKLKISEPTMTRRLRRELANDEQEQIISIINDIEKERRGE